MAGKEKVDIKRSDQFQEMEDALAKAMEDLDSTMNRVSALFETGDDALPDSAASAVAESDEQAPAEPDSEAAGQPDADADATGQSDTGTDAAVEASASENENGED